MDQDVGANYNTTPQQRQRLAELFDRLEWKESGKGAFLPNVLQDIILQFGLRRFSHFAASYEMSPSGLYSVRNPYRNSPVDFYVCVAGHNQRRFAVAPGVCQRRLPFAACASDQQAD